MGFIKWLTGARPTAEQFQSSIEEEGLNRVTSTTRPDAADCTDMMHIAETDTRRYKRWNAAAGAWEPAFPGTVLASSVGSNWSAATNMIGGGTTPTWVTDGQVTVDLPAARKVRVDVKLSFAHAVAGQSLYPGIQVTNGTSTPYFDTAVTEVSGNSTHSATFHITLNAGSNLIKPGVQLFGGVTGQTVGPIANPISIVVIDEGN
jgi:hypothetical protein